MDFLTKHQRSRLMSRVHSKGNRKTELRLVAVFRAERIYGWRRNYSLFGKPDFVFPKLHVALFVDGCFWHCCPRHGSYPKSNRAFWTAKLEQNAARDRLVTETLRSDGWDVVRIWQHDLTKTNLPRCLATLRKVLALSQSRSAKTQVQRTARTAERDERRRRLHDDPEISPPKKARKCPA